MHWSHDATAHRVTAFCQGGPAATLYAGLGDSLDAVNPKLQDTEEIQFVVAPKSPNASNLVNAQGGPRGPLLGSGCQWDCSCTPPSPTGRLPCPTTRRGPQHRLTVCRSGGLSRQNEPT